MQSGIRILDRQTGFDDSRKRIERPQGGPGGVRAKPE